MAKVVDVRYREGGKTYRFDVNGLDLKAGDEVIVENQKGKAFAYVASTPLEEIAERKKPLKKVLRTATEEDREKKASNKERETKAYDLCRKLVAEKELDMKLVATECAWGAKKMTFYFTADERVDFRELVKELAAELHTRIEMRQIGVRDETTICGGIGICGRELCCCTYLNGFAPVSIKMAKAQNLSLNPEKISGVCGRLMCCLRNEAETYEELNKTVPKMGEKVGTPEDLRGQVVSLDVIRQKVKVLVELDEENKEIREYDASELQFKPRGRKGGKDKENKDKKDKGDKSQRDRKNKNKHKDDKRRDDNKESAEPEEKQES